LRLQEWKLSVRFIPSLAQLSEKKGPVVAKWGC
jgi:hypothetical protein